MSDRSVVTSWLHSLCERSEAKEWFCVLHSRKSWVWAIHFGVAEITMRNVLLQALFLLIIFAQNPYYLYVTSIMGGWLSANLVNAMAMFVSDVSDDRWVVHCATSLHAPMNNNNDSDCRMRGSLIACYDTAFNVGAALAYFIAKYFNLVDQAKVLLVFPVLFLVMFIGIPQTPQHLARKGDKEVCVCVSMQPNVMNVDLLWLL